MKIMKKVILFSLIMTILFIGCTQMSAEEIAKKMQERYASLKDMKGTMVITTQFKGMEQSKQIQFAMKKPDKFRSEDEKMLMVSNGKTMWIYDKQRNVVTKVNLPKIKQPEFDYGKIVKDMLDKYDVKYLGEEKVSGRDCYVIELIPKETKLVIKQKLWVDKNFWYPLKIESSYNKFNSTIEYHNVEFNTGIDDKEFEFVLPEGAKVVRQRLPERLTINEAQERVNFTILVPKYTAGYEFDHAVVFKFGEKESVMLNYEKGYEFLTIAESPAGKQSFLPNATKVKIKDIEGDFSEMFENKVLRFSFNGLEIVITGKIEKGELIKVAESMI